MLRNAMQLCLSPEDAITLKHILKFNDKFKMTKGKTSLTSHDGIDEDAAMGLYKTFLGKLSDSVYGKRLSAQAATLKGKMATFEKLPLSEKCLVLGEILHFFQCNATLSNLTMIDGGKSAGMLTLAANLKETDDATWIIQSVTGFFEKKIPLWHGEE